MYTKITHGTSFLAAITYDAEGLSEKQKKQKQGKVELLETNNVFGTEPALLAKQMALVAATSRTQKPCWNIAMSAPQGETLTGEQWKQAAELNLKAMGIQPDQHQYVIYRHRDTTHDHIHIALNAVPVHSGPALSRQFVARKARKAAQGINNAFGIVATKGHGIQDTIVERLTAVLKQRPITPGDLKEDLLKAGVVVDYMKDTNANIRGVTFQLAKKNHKPIKGSKIGYKWNQIALLLETNRAQYEAEIERLRQEKAQIERERDQARSQPPQAEIGPVSNNEKEVEELRKQVKVLNRVITETRTKLTDEYYELREERDKIQEENITLTRQHNDIQRDREQQKKEIERLRQQIRQIERDQARSQPQKTVEKQVSDPNQARIIEEQRTEIERLKKQLDLQERAQADFKKQFNYDASPAQMKALLAGKQLDMPKIGLKIGLQAGRFVSEPLQEAPQVATPRPATGETLQQQFVREFGVIPKLETIAKLEAGQRVNFGKLGKTIWVNDGKLTSKPYVKQAQAATLAPTPTPALVPAHEPAAVHTGTPEQAPAQEPQWHIVARTTLKEKRKTPALTSQGLKFEVIKNKKGVAVDLKIWKDNKENAVLASELAPNSKMLQSQGLKIK